MASKKTYWKNIAVSTQSLMVGLKITLSHLLKSRKSRKTKAITDHDYFTHTEGINTIQYRFNIHAYFQFFNVAAGN